MTPPSFGTRHRQAIRRVLIVVGLLLVLLSAWNVWTTYQNVTAPQSQEIHITLPAPALTATPR